MKSAKRELFKSLSRYIDSASVLKAMEEVPRELFVPPELRHLAYQDIALGIGEGQTISQPYIVALMTQALELTGSERVLEIGTGSGYQAAVISNLLTEGHLYTVERIPVLTERARNLLSSLGYDNVTVEMAGEVLGAPHHGPFDAIIVTAAAPNIALSLVEQLAMGGRLVIPVGSQDSQNLVQARRTEEGLSIRYLEACRFVPLIGKEAFANSRDSQD